MSRDNTILKQIGAAIRKHREDLEYSQEKLAELSEVDRSFICGVERGSNNISILTLCQITDALGISFKQLVASMDK